MAASSSGFSKVDNVGGKAGAAILSSHPGSSVVKNSDGLYGITDSSGQFLVQPSKPAGDQTWQEALGLTAAFLGLPSVFDAVGIGSGVAAGTGAAVAPVSTAGFVAPEVGLTDSAAAALADAGGAGLASSIAPVSAAALAAPEVGLTADAASALGAAGVTGAAAPIEELVINGGLGGAGAGADIGSLGQIVGAGGGAATLAQAAGMPTDASANLGGDTPQSLNNIISKAAGPGVNPTAGIGGWTANLANSGTLVNAATGQTFNPITGAYDAMSGLGGPTGAAGLPNIPTPTPGASTPSVVTPPATQPPAPVSTATPTPVGTPAATPPASSIPSWLAPFVSPQGLAAAATGIAALTGGAGGSGSGGSGSSSGSQQQILDTQNKLANDLMAKWESGQLNAADAYSVDQFKQQQTAAYQQYFANAGLSDSTMALDAIRGVDAQAAAMQSKFLNTYLTDAISALGGAGSTAQQVVANQLASDQQSNTLLNNFFTALSKVSMPTTPTDNQGTVGSNP